MTIQQFIKDREIVAVVKPAQGNPAMDPGKNASADERRWYQEATHYRVTLKRPDGRRMSVPFSCGPMADYPTAECVLDCILSDASSVEAGTFEEFCSEFGYDTDSRRAERTYKVCRSIAERLKSFLGHEYKMAIYEMERL